MVWLGGLGFRLDSLIIRGGVILMGKPGFESEKTTGGPKAFFPDKKAQVEGVNLGST